MTSFLVKDCIRHSSGIENVDNDPRVTIAQGIDVIIAGIAVSVLAGCIFYCLTECPGSEWQPIVTPHVALFSGGAFYAIGGYLIDKGLQELPKNNQPLSVWEGISDKNL